MPDFEALVRYQQSSLRPATERLKVVTKFPTSGQQTTSDDKTLSTLFFGFLGGLFGAIMGTSLIFYLSAKDLINLKTLF